MTTQTQNFETMLRDTMNAFPVKGDAFGDGFKRTAELNEKLAHIVVDAAGRSTELSTEWTRDTLGRFAEVTKAKSEPTAYMQGLADFGTKQTEATVERMTAFAEVAKSAQMATIEVLMEAGRAYGDHAAKAASTTTRKTAGAAKSAASTAAK